MGKVDIKIEQAPHNGVVCKLCQTNKTIENKKDKFIVFLDFCEYCDLDDFLSSCEKGRSVFSARDNMKAGFRLCHEHKEMLISNLINHGFKVEYGKEIKLDFDTLKELCAA